MQNKVEHRLKWEFYCLCLLAFSLPILETTKHLFSIIYLLLFTYRAFFYRESITPNPVGKYIIIFIVSSIIAAIGAIINGYEVHKLHDIIRYSLVGIMLCYTPFSKKQLYIILLTLIGSALIGSLEAHINVIADVKKSFELRSVGHINHSSIYLLLIAGITLPLILKKYLKVWHHVVVWLINLAIIYSLIETNSRATALGLVSIGLSLLFIVFIKFRTMAYILCGATLISATYFSQNPPRIVNKFIGNNIHYAGKLKPRERIWHAAYYVWKKEPIFGIGHGNYKSINLQKMKEWYPDSAINFSDKEQFLYFSHTHNRYINTLAEAGVVGLLGLLALLLGILYFFLRQAAASLKNGDDTVIWFIGFNTLLATSVVGLFNTTLHHEHGLLAMMILGLCCRHLSNKSHQSTVESNTGLNHTR